MTLDGLPASHRFKPCGRFVLIYRKDGKGGDVEFSRAAFDRVQAKGGNFIS